jgi:NAD(P)-dependent dehydrogenase (short-subunit alcohol dehydrogenase family)
VTTRPARRARRRLTLADDGIIDPIALELAARGARTVALTRPERQLAAAAILARGGTPYVISQRLHVSGTTALALAARCQGVPS